VSWRWEGGTSRLGILGALELLKENKKSMFMMPSLGNNHP